MDLDEARRLHARWRERLEHAAAGGHAALDTATTADAGQCAFGAWLKGEGQERHGGQAAWRQCVQRHDDFHRAAGSVAAALNRGDPAAARAMLSAGTPFAGAERALLAAIEALRVQPTPARAQPTDGEAQPAAPRMRASA
jgi:methyl-accepting chemotaxis protein